MSEPNAPQWLEMLSTAECMDHLRATRLGRVGFTLRGRPVILPVVYSVDDRSIWFLTEEGSKLSAAVARAFVAFEIDHLDERGGWSVLVVGQTERDTDAARIAAMRASGLVAGAPGRRDHLIRLPIQQVSGRSFSSEGRAFIAGYL